ncbi:Ldh family oxidoreductase [Limobrevibacterium gyesilva]|uniref:Ldh family oxidoreductase n=1 Tax=Limobrevibacterium gyesilva TaxID=2991712 RepID=A0AA42CJ14_9PROT|nr:Ldh family oxidoreductase [Limobrevibacterium gyesilva]MCW3476450.1 Ldh family oxidoreductase [Limobrevibacterium gyesilva]
MPAALETHRTQIEAILLAWGMAAANAAETAEILAWADLHGIDSHGMSMLTGYDSWRRQGKLNLACAPRIVRESPVSALVDGDAGLGHVPAAFAMRLAVAKAKQVGLAAVAVRNSAHFGACGYYSMLAVDAGLIGITTTTASGVRVAPTGGAEAKLGTDPWCFGAPGEAGRPFLLDMATTTVAFGRVRNKANEDLPAPPGWVLTPDGQPSTDPLDVVQRPGFLTSLGGTRENSSYKGYGLAMMVDILAGALSGVTFPSDPGHAKAEGGVNLGHFFLAMDPGLFRDPAEFRTDVARFCGQMRATTPADPATPVLVAGDPERATAARRRAEGIPVGPGLLAQIRTIAEASGAPWLLG